MISVLILTHNEALDLPGCLASLSWCDDIVIYDSYSVDSTIQIAHQYQARIFQRPHQDLSIAFGGDEATHRNWSLREIPYLHPWLLVLDADERLSANCLEELHEVVSFSSDLDKKSVTHPVAFQLRRRDFYLGRHLKHVQATPWYIRLFRPEYVHYERLINPITIVNGPIGTLQCYIDHYPFSKGLSHWISRHNTYSTLEARQEYSHMSASGSLFTAFLHSDFYQRRFQQKLLFTTLPCRPLIKFLWLYILKRGFLDCGAGFTYALLQAVYELFIVLKLRELNHPSAFVRSSSIIDL